LILSLGRFVLRSTCQFAANFCSQPGCEEMRFSVNVSPRQFTDPKLLDIIEEALEDSGLPAKNLEIEITESSMIMNVERTREILERLEWLGVTIAIDDFGTGYSSLTQLKNFPIHTLKIDRSFVMDVPGNKSDEKIIETIILMARHLGIEGVAEGVETEAQRRFLEQLGCEKMQGFLISPPVPGAELQTVYDRLKFGPEAPACRAF
jgi:EAL domain-containing protein (putative c-di-GMP-specific phosphodiesterase class I)